MKQIIPHKAVRPMELVLVAFLAICAILAVVQGLGMLGASMAASEHSAPVR